MGDDDHARFCYLSSVVNWRYHHNVLCDSKSQHDKKGSVHGGKRHGLPYLHERYTCFKSVRVTNVHHYETCNLHGLLRCGNENVNEGNTDQEISGGVAEYF